MDNKDATHIRFLIGHLVTSKDITSDLVNIVRMTADSPKEFYQALDYIESAFLKLNDLDRIYKVFSESDCPYVRVAAGALASRKIYKI